MSLTREDKIWLSRLAALLLRGVGEVICAAFKTQIAISRARDLRTFGETDTSAYFTDYDGTGEVQQEKKERS